VITGTGVGVVTGEGFIWGVAIGVAFTAGVAFIAGVATGTGSRFCGLISVDEGTFGTWGS